MDAAGMEKIHHAQRGSDTLTVARPHTLSLRQLHARLQTGTPVAADERGKK